MILAIIKMNQKALEFLKSYKGSQGTFNAYRREIERLLHWSTLVAKKTLKDLKRQDMEDFIHFCQKPPKSWIGVNKFPRFINISFWLYSLSQINHKNKLFYLHDR